MGTILKKCKSIMNRCSDARIEYFAIRPKSKFLGCSTRANHIASLGALPLKDMEKPPNIGGN